LAVKNQLACDFHVDLPMKRLTCALCVALGLQPLFACGPDFEMLLLEDRAGALTRLPEGFFAYEMSRMQPRTNPALPARTVPHDPWFWPNESNPISAAQIAFEQQGYSTLQKAEHQQARLASDAASAIAAAGSLPPVHQHYIAGAVAYRQGDWEAAQQHFDSALRLAAPADDWRLSTLFMLGRLAQISDNQAQALRHFDALTAQVLSTQRDPMGLASAALGERARLDWQLAKDSSTPEPAREAALLRALDLYLEQAAQAPAGDGVDSLRYVARAMSRDASLLAIAIRHQKPQQLIAAYAYARGDNAFYDPFADTESEDAAPTTPLVMRVLDAAQRQNIKSLAGGDYLAAALYSEGQFDQAQAFVQGQESALAHWVYAKLALRAGDQKKAAEHYALAAPGFPSFADWDARMPFDPQTSPRCRVQGEAGVLALSRADYLQAAELFYAAAGSYSSDLSFVAERVLTLPELKKFVDDNTQAKPVATLAPANYSELANKREAVNYQLRAILARRLMRSGDMAQALDYFDAAEQRKAAESYRQQVQLAQKSNTMDGAEAAFAAARIARQSGMEILGFELAPDYYFYGGSFGSDIAELAMASSGARPAAAGIRSAPAAGQHGEAGSALSLSLYRHRLG
jgi:hypothetical protein